MKAIVHFHTAYYQSMGYICVRYLRFRPMSNYRLPLGIQDRSTAPGREITDHVALNETVPHPDNERDWLLVAVDPKRPTFHTCDFLRCVRPYSPSDCSDNSTRTTTSLPLFLGGGVLLIQAPLHRWNTDFSVSPTERVSLSNEPRTDQTPNQPVSKPFPPPRPKPPDRGSNRFLHVELITPSDAVSKPRRPPEFARICLANAVAFGRANSANSQCMQNLLAVRERNLFPIELLWHL